MHANQCFGMFAISAAKTGPLTARTKVFSAKNEVIRLVTGDSSMG
jgi:hypothetical protein